MKGATQFANEAQRLKVLEAYGILDTPPEKVFDDLAALAARACGTPMAAIAMVDKDRVWFKSAKNIAFSEVPAKTSFCRYAIREPEIFTVSDTAADERFAGGPLVKGEPRVRFYAGAPLVSPEGIPVGTLHVLSCEPRELEAEEGETLRILAQSVMAHLELRRQSAVPERRRLFELSADMFCIAGFNDTFMRLNPVWEQTLGYSMKELTERPLLDFVHPDDREATRNELQRLTEGNETRSFENRYCCRDGSVIWLSWKAVPAMEEQLIYAVAREITEQKRVAAALRESEKRYRTLVDGARDVIFTLSHDRKITSLNPVFEEITGWSREDWIGKSFLPIIDPRDAPQAVELFERIMQGEAPPAFELRLKARPEGVIPIEFTVTLQTFEGRPVGVLGIGRDIGERKQLEDHIRQVQKMDSIGRLAAGIAHDFNNLLTVQQGYLSLILDKLKDRPEIIERLRGISRAADRAAELTHRLLLFSRKQDVNIRTADFRNIVEGTTKMLGRILGEDIVLEVECEKDLPLVEADPGMIEQAIINLAVNARDAMPNGGTLRIHAETIQFAVGKDAGSEARSGRFVRLTVEDAGCGIDPEHLKNIFEPFFTTKEVGKGVGLGLATVYGVVRQHRGWVDVDSELNRGTRFRIHIPVADNEADEQDRWTASGSKATRDESILVVEDEPGLRDMVEAVLKQEGYRVIGADSGPDALKTWETDGGYIDLLVTDLALPGGLNGAELADRLQRNHPRLKVLYTSGYDPGLVECKAIPPALFLQKPYRIQDLVSAVRRCLDES